MDKVSNSNSEVFVGSVLIFREGNRTMRTYTNHARAFMAIGYEYFNRDGSIYISCLIRSRRMLATKLRKLSHKLEHPDSVFIVENANGSLRTVGRDHRRNHRAYPAKGEN